MRLSDTNPCGLSGGWWDQCPGRFLSIIGQDPCVPKSNRLLVDVVRFFFIGLRYIPWTHLQWSATGYFSNSSASSVTSDRFSRFSLYTGWDSDAGPSCLSLVTITIYNEEIGKLVGVLVVFQVDMEVTPNFWSSKVCMLQSAQHSPIMCGKFVTPGNAHFLIWEVIFLCFYYFVGGLPCIVKNGHLQLHHGTSWLV
jgi:hypothetical protein